MASREELLDELLKDYKTPEDLLGKNGIVKQLTKALIERALQAELTDHLGYDKHASAGRDSGNARNGTSAKTLKTDQGDLPLDIPRDRQSDFDPPLVPKEQRRSGVLDEKIISLYARGLTVSEIQGHLEELYGTEVSKGLISTVTNAVWDEVTAWQNQPLYSVYPIVYFDATSSQDSCREHPDQPGRLSGIGGQRSGRKRAVRPLDRPNGRRQMLVRHPQ